MLGDALAHRGHRLERLAGLSSPAARRSRSRRRCRRGGRRCRSGSGRRGGRRRRRAPERAAGRLRRGRRPAPPDSTKPRMSFFVTRPPRPVPGTWRDVDAVLGRDPRDDRGDEASCRCRSTPSAARSRLRARRRRRRGRLGGSAVGVGARRRSRLRLGGGLRGRRLGRRRRRPARAAAAPSRRDHRELRADLDRLALLDEDLLRRRPSPGLGTSVSTLSVEISSSGSSASICSPSCLSHFVIVPSETETPIWGMTTSIARVGRPSSTPPARCSPCDDVVDLRDERLLERRRERDRRVGRGDPPDRRVEVLEGLLGDRRRDLGAEAAGARVLVEDEHLRRLARRARAPPPCPTASACAGRGSRPRRRPPRAPSRPRRRCRPSRPR